MCISIFLSTHTFLSLVKTPYNIEHLNHQKTAPSAETALPYGNLVMSTLNLMLNLYSHRSRTRVYNVDSALPLVYFRMVHFRL